MMEKFIDIPGFEGRYKASSNGQILSCPKTNIDKILKQRIEDGYLVITSGKRPHRKKLRVHRLIALTFIPNPQNKPEVNHIDGNKQNNHYANLEWCTRKENAEHASLNRLVSHGEDHKCQSN